MGFREKLVPIAIHLPKFIIKGFFKLMMLIPRLMRFIDGTAQISSVGMVGKGYRWPIALLYMHTVGLWIGAVLRKPMPYEGEMAMRDCLHFAISMNHDIVDGAPSTRFLADLVKLLSSGELLNEFND